MEEKLEVGEGLASQVLHRHVGFHWSISIQNGKSGERIKSKVSGHNDTALAMFQSLGEARKKLTKQIKETHEELTKNEVR
ncbi:hypothetical protein AKJ58_01105 [candidate division MSBL1 archaeon SCGC-AAA385D11]|uniref:Uncharacterized protein n=1 Tax=candidate division MSBL1 archaeon SCGC-AAA385D11 TaxID=1698286 RepID=A0A133VNK8_9EURY|nr:hypothetical protein AKJ58_01105 [candidate division MSBL1 archaeon SCGC-AAA385D11]